MRLEQFFQKHDEYASLERAREVSEVHVARALTELYGSVFPDYGLKGAQFVRRVERLERGQVESLCFTLMPFSEELRAVFTDAIKPAAEDAGLRCERAHEIARPGVVLDQIDDAIRRARVVVADLTGLNPNVLQEVGFARCSRKQVVLITQQRPGELPFDFRHFRTQQYRLGEDSLRLLRGWLGKSLLEILQERVPDEARSVVGHLQLSFDYVRAHIEPKLSAQGYEIIIQATRRPMNTDWLDGRM
jgi:hypothetical protein